MSSGRSNDKRFRSGRSLSSNNTIESSTAVVGMITDPVLNSVDTSRPSPSLVSNEADSSGHNTELSETIAKYQSDMVQKDELITALIAELEQAVEQLDRFQRTGANRSHSASAQNGYSNGVSEPQSPLMDDLRRMAEDWEQAQPASALERIESQLAAMHDLVLNLQNNGSSGKNDRVSSEVLDFEDRVRRLNADTAAEEQQDQDTANMTLDESSPSWEAIKRQIFGGSGSEPATENNNHDAEDSELLRLLNETPAPGEINFDTADLNELKQALSERDAYIIQLNRLFRTKNSFTLPADWSVLANVPNEMQVRVESLVERLDVQVRLGEVELSLERARLARERSQIQGEREMIEKHMRRLGLKSLADLDNISATTGSAGDRRWMRFLGPNTK